MRYRALVFALFSTVCSSGARADGVERWHYGGFISQSAINTSDNNFFGHSDDYLNFDFREIAFIFNGNPISALEFSSQILSRKAGIADDGKPQLDYGFVTWRFQEGLNATQGFSLGRLKLPIGFLNESRDSPFSRMSVFLPQGLYGDRFRSSTMTADELLYFGEYRSDAWIVGLKTGYGYSNPDRKELIDIFPAKLPFEKIDFNQATKWNVQFLADYDGGRFRWALTRVNIPVDYEASIQSFTLKSSVKTYMTVLSFEWNESAFSFTAEAHRAVVHYGKIPVVVSGSTPHPSYPVASYVQLKWHARPRFDMFLRYDVNIFDIKDEDGRKSEQATGTPGFTKFFYDREMGASFRPSDAWLILAEFHQINGAMSVSERETAEDKLKRHWNMAAVSVAWRF